MRQVLDALAMPPNVSWGVRQRTPESVLTVQGDGERTEEPGMDSGAELA